MKKQGIAVLMATTVMVSGWSGIPLQKDSKAAKVSVQATDRTGYTAISKKQELKAITSDGKYYLTADIDMSGEVWQPIGGFSGVFDGNGHTISNLNSVGTNGGGLFDSIKGSATITDVKLENIDITNSGGLPIGGIVGKIAITQQDKVEISNCSVNGKITGQKYVGGIVGETGFAEETETTEIPISITNCKVQGTLIGTLQNVEGAIGGIGGNIQYTKIEKCCNKAGIQHQQYSNTSYIGGIAGCIQSGKLENSFHAGQISIGSEHSRIYTGGIAGMASATNILNVENIGGFANHNHTTGLVSSLKNGSTLSYGINTYAGTNYAPYPIVRESTEDSSVMQCYYISHDNVETTEFGTAFTTAEMKNASKFSSFDFASVWKMDSAILYGYPILNELKDCYEKSVTSISFTQSQINLSVDESANLQLVSEPANADMGTITYKSDDTSIVDVSETGEVTGVKPGTTRIIAENSYGVAATCTVEVSGYKPTSISISGKNYQMAVGDEALDLKDKCTISPTKAKDDVLTWTSSDSNIVEISADGKATAKSGGEATITVTTSNGKSASCVITVKDIVITTAAEKTLDLGANEKLAYTIQYSNGDTVNVSSSKVSISSDQPQVVYVTSSGQMTALATGTATITITYGNRSVSCKVTVPEIVLTLPESKEVCLGNTVDLLYETVKVAQRNTIMSQIQWASSNPKVATVNTSGVVTALKAGSCTISATYNGVTYNCNVTVPKVKIKLSKTSLKIRKKNNATISYSYTPIGSKISIKKITASKKKIVNVSQREGSISIKGWKKGKTTLKVVFTNGTKKTIKIKVVK